MTELQKICAHVGGALIDYAFENAPELTNSRPSAQVHQAGEDVAVATDTDTHAANVDAPPFVETDSQPEVAEYAIKVKLVRAFSGVENGVGKIGIDVFFFGVEDAGGFNAFSASVGLDNPGNAALSNVQHAQVTTDKFSVHAENGKMGGFTSSNKIVQQDGIVTRLVWTGVPEGPHTVELTDIRITNNAISNGHRVPHTPENVSVFVTV